MQLRELFPDPLPDEPQPSIPPIRIHGSMALRKPMLGGGSKNVYKCRVILGEFP